MSSQIGNYKLGGLGHAKLYKFINSKQTTTITPYDPLEVYENSYILND
jgi:hypothetical protein